MPNGTHSSAYLSFAAELARQPVLYRRLLVEHAADRAGHCLACTAPGSQTKHPFPCAIWKIAEAASTIRSTWPRTRQLALIKDNAPTPPDGEIGASCAGC